MSKCIPFQIINGYGILCMSETDFRCPKCGYLHKEADYYYRLEKSKYGLIYKQCKGCKTRLGITPGYNGDIYVWEKSTEKIIDKYWK